MSDLRIKDECQKIIDEAGAVLRINTEWIRRYAVYSEAISANVQKIRNRKNQFREWKPLCLYLNVGSAKKRTETIRFNLRYCGQAVADIAVNEHDLILSNKKYTKENRDFGCQIILDENTSWTNEAARKFRKYFSEFPKRMSDCKKKNDEHRIESVLLTELTKKIGIDKVRALHNVRPVRIGDICRFQMPSPFGASKFVCKYAGCNGGGIDILARVGKGRGAKLCVMEIKDEYSKREPPEKVLKQGLLYAAFVRALLRSDSGERWWKIFGFSRDLPKTLIIDVACVMPFNMVGESDKTFANKEVMKDRDLFRLHYLYFEEKDNAIQRVETSLGKQL